MGLDLPRGELIARPAPAEADVAAFLESTCLFCQPWWLEAVSPGHWAVGVVHRGPDVAAVLPYTYRTKLGRFRLIEMPPLTPYLGPWLRASSARYAKRLAEQKELMTALIEQLPRTAVFHQAFHPSITNWLPFYWKRYCQRTRYTYRIDAGLNEKAVWEGMLANIRTDIRKAERELTVKDEDNVDRFIELHHATFTRQGKKLPYPEHALRRLDSVCAARGVRRMLFAIDRDGRYHAAIYLVWDASDVYYLAGAADPALRHSGAGSLLLWEGIRIALRSGRRFDFEGSVVESIERVFRAFGAVQVPFFEVFRTDSRVVATYRAACRLLTRSA